jgi:AcrR family transcriptional regulator
MSLTRPYRSPARQARREQTRQAIVEAFIAQLGDPGRAALSPAAAARAAGVSIRTVHHYFPDAGAQLAAVAAEVESRLFPRPAPLPQSPAELPALVTAVYRAAEGQLPLLRALVTSSVGSQVRRRRRARRLQAIQDTLKQIGAGQDETRRAIAIVSLLASADAAVVLADQYGLTLGEAGQACAEATRAIISHLAQATPGHGTHRQQAPPAPATASPDQGQSTPCSRS